MMIKLEDADWTHAFSHILGDEIHKRRRARRWIRRDVLARLSEDISLQTLATYELGTRKLTVVRFVDICHALDTTAADVLARVYERWQDDPDAAVGWTVDLPAAARLDETELAPLRRWADHRMGELTDGRLTTAWLTRPAVDALAVLCRLKPMDLVRRLPRRDPV